MFMTLYANPSFGVLLALTLMIHNFPEAISVSLPIYTATKKAWKSVGAAMIVGMFQPIGAGIGYALLISTGFSDLAQALIYAPLSGMLTVIVVKGLLPTAFKVCKNVDEVTTWVLLGIATMFLANSIASYA
jgi:zinc transporter, ZIP family